MQARMILALVTVCLVGALAAGQQAPQAGATSQPGPSGTGPSPAQVLGQLQAEKDAGQLKNNPPRARAALEAIKNILAQDPTNGTANLLAGEIMMDNNDYDGARDYFRNVVEVEPNNFRANVGLGRINNANRSWRQAAKYLETAERVATDATRTAEVKRALAYAYAGMGDQTKAIQKANEAVQAVPADLDAHQAAVEIQLSAAGREPRYLEGALAAATTYVQKCKDDVQSQVWDRARIARLDRAYDLLLSALKEVHSSFYERDIRNQPTDKLLRGKNVEAAAVLNRVAEVVGEQAAVKLTLAQFDALLSAEKAVEYDPKNIKYLENLATLYQRIQNREKAVDTCRKILELDPQHAAAQQYLKSVGEPTTAQPTDG